MQVERGASVLSIFQSVYEAFRLLFSKSDVIATSAPLPIVFCLSLFLYHGTLTSGYFALSALMRDFVCNGGGTDGVDKSGLSSSYKKIIPL